MKPSAPKLERARSRENVAISKKMSQEKKKVVDVEMSIEDDNKKVKLRKVASKENARPTVISEADKQKIEDHNKKIQEISKTLIRYRWYHGLMPKDEIEPLLKRDGDWVVRMRGDKGMRMFCITTRSQGKIVHIPMKVVDGKWTCHAAPISNAKLNLVLDSMSLKFLIQRPIPRPSYYLLHDNITLDKKIGSGAFGEVWKGKLTKDGAWRECAVKRMKLSLSQKVALTVIKEAKLMRSLNHRNIVRVLGVATQEEPFMIVLELARGGSIKDYCKHNPNCRSQQLVEFSVDAARGMAYLALKMVIHRDLAARNCLLGANNELKISDFGLSVAGKVEVKEQYIKAVPIKWLSPESIQQGIFTEKTDVWSYGILLWEIFMRCTSDPFPNMSNKEAMQIIKEAEVPMTAPKETPKEVEVVMAECFRKIPEQRPTFAAILKKLKPDEDAVGDEKSTAGAFSMFLPAMEKPPPDTSPLKLSPSVVALYPETSSSIPDSMYIAAQPSQTFTAMPTSPVVVESASKTPQKSAKDKDNAKETKEREATKEPTEQQKKTKLLGRPKSGDHGEQRKSNKKVAHEKSADS